MSVAAARLVELFVFYQEGHLAAEQKLQYYQGAPFVLSTVFFTGMFTVFYSAFAFVLVLYMDQVRIVWNLTFLASGQKNSLPGGPESPDPNGRPRHQLDDDEHTRYLSAGRSMLFREDSVSEYSAESHTATRLQPYNISHVRAWDEVRRIAAFNISSPDSVLNSYFTPTVYVVCILFIGCYLYIVVRFVFAVGTAGPILFMTAFLICIFLLYLRLVLGVAKRARKHFKLHSVIMARITFDVASEIDLRTWRHQHNMDRLDLRRQGLRDYTIAELHSLYLSFSSLRSHMEATSPRPLILGIEQRHVKFAVAYLLLLSAVVMFFALMRAINANDECGKRVGNATSVPPTVGL